MWHFSIAFKPDPWRFFYSYVDLLSSPPPLLPRGLFFTSPGYAFRVDAKLRGFLASLSPKRIGRPPPRV